MIVEGERIKELVGRAEREVILCAPFVKAQVLRIILGIISEGVWVRVITRWRPAEVAAGLSDLEVYEIATRRSHTELSLFESLHAKVYVSDDECLVGSANLTAMALGWCKDSNLEILYPARRCDPDVANLLDRLGAATPATFQIRAEIEKQAAALEGPELDESQDVPAEIADRFSVPWLPRCAAPDKLFAVHRNSATTSVVEGTRADAMADLNDLMPPQELTREDFNSYVNATLHQMPYFRRILERIPGRLSDAEGTAMIGELRPELSHTDRQHQWRIVREWINTFFQDRFEVAPDSYVIRLKSQ